MALTAAGVACGGGGGSAAGNLEIILEPGTALTDPRDQFLRLEVDSGDPTKPMVDQTWPIGASYSVGDVPPGSPRNFRVQVEEAQGPPPVILYAGTSAGRNLVPGTNTIIDIYLSRLQ